ncbi:MAG: DNA mismatch repair endonuclease MutL, partial [Planctomycetes bacterium]|nr:DNA mismatch repair endonuclease MutL [Planctomycetota bacterium]
MGRIRVLPETVQNKIAAGEVVERPASVVKELVENSIDAGATSVAVEIEDGGHRLIRVTDDGCGMDEEDLVASMQRHATSKISSADDIFAIKSFGFRGEALPSVGSVSRMSIHTAVHGQPSGHELRVEGGELIRIAPAQSRRGTRIEVRDIFYNTPARRKFLRSGAAEATQTLAVMTRLALGNPGLAFRLQNGDKITLAVEPKTSQMERIRDIFGTDLAEKMLPFARNVNDQLSFDGFVARPPESNRNSSFIYLLVNNRWIRSFGLFRALADAFQGAIQPRHYPKAVVNITVNPERIDVNVHPAKEEIRFDDERALIGGIKQAIREALGMAGGTTTFHAVAAAAPAAQPKPAGTVDKSQLPDRGQPGLGFKSNLAGNKQDLSKLDLKKARDYIRRSGEKADGPNAAAPEPPPAGSYDGGGATASPPRREAASESDRAAYPETETISPFST